MPSLHVGATFVIVYYAVKARQWVSPLAVLAFAWYFKGQPTYRDEADLARKATSASAAAPASTSTSTKKSIAVLPFVNMSSDAGNEFFADGMDERVDRLA